jgi:glycosyltransferase involved in cell wall biosynthesis
MNILVVSSKFPPEYSGSGLRCHNTYLRLRKKYGINYQVLTSSVTDNKNKIYEVDGISVKRISYKIFHSSYFLNYSSASYALNSICKLVGKIYYRLDYCIEALYTFAFLFRLRQWTDVIHVFGNVNVTAATLSFAKIFNKKVVYEVVNFKNNEDYDPLAYYEPLVIKWLYGVGIKKNWQVITISRILYKLCQKHNPNAKIVNRPNPVNESKYHPVSSTSKREIRQNLSKFSDQDYVIINVSKFIPRKNQILLIESLRYLPGRYKLLMIGPLVESGPLAERDRLYFQKIVNRVNSLKLQNRIQIKTGFFNDVEKYFQMSDVFAFPTTDEALGTPMLESLSCAVPVVMTRILGVSDVWIDEGVNGFLCELDEQEFAEKIELTSSLKHSDSKQKSNEILQTASTQAIDKQYYHIFSSLTE